MEEDYELINREEFIRRMEENVRMKRVKLTEDVYLNEELAEYKLEIEDSILNKISVLKGVFHSIKIGKKCRMDSFHVIGGEFHELHIENSEIRWVSFSNIHFKKDFRIHNLKSSSLNLGFDGGGCSFGGTSEILRGKYDIVDIDRCNFNILQIENTIIETYLKIRSYESNPETMNGINYLKINNISGGYCFEIQQYKINKICIEKIILQGNNIISKLGAIYFKELEIKNCVFNEFLQIANLQGNQSVINILDSDFGNTKFFHCDFKKLKTLFISQSKLIDISTDVVTWPKAIASRDSYDEREVFRQLKTLMSKQGNLLMELEFRSKEFDAFRRLKDIKFLDRVILCIWKITNNYNQNWLIPTIWFLMGGFLIFNLELYISGLGFYEYQTKYFTFLNPIHKEDYIAELSGWALAIDFVGRIYVSFFIYQTLKAFRKFSG